MRFVNDLEYHNIASKDVFHNNMWKTIYYAIKDIKKDEQLSVSYGELYWSDKFKLSLSDTEYLVEK